MKTIKKSANGGTTGKMPAGKTDSKAKSFTAKAGHKSAKSSSKGTMSKAKTYC